MDVSGCSKMFNNGTLLRCLQSQGMFENYVELLNICDVLCGMLLVNGRFAFLLKQGTRGFA